MPGPVENKGCPYGDKDGDGILDNDDKCPEEPEDKDGFDDEDGCPDPDNDADGILDVNDKCPMQPENMNGHEDEDGCPDVKLELVEVNREIGKIEIKQKIFFDFGKASIKVVSFELLNQVAQALQVQSGPPGARGRAHRLRREQPEQPEALAAALGLRDALSARPGHHVGPAGGEGLRRGAADRHEPHEAGA